MRTAANQWNESALMREFERQGMIVRKSLGPTIECPLDYRRNQSGGFMASDTASQTLTKTDVLTAASYAPAEISVPVVWSKGDDAQNPAENQKVALVKSLLQNGINSHDDLIEEALFGGATQTFNGAATVIPVGGAGTVGGIDASTETWWANYSATYADDGSDIEAALTTAHNTVAKGSGSNLTPTVLFMGADPHALYEGSLQTKARYIDVKEGDAGFKILAFKTARCVFSQYGGSKIYGANKQSLNLVVSKEYFRDKGKEQEINDENAFRVFIYSALQLVTNNKSRLFVLDAA